MTYDEAVAAALEYFIDDLNRRHRLAIEERDVEEKRAEDAQLNELLIAA